MIFKFNLIAVFSSLLLLVGCCVAAAQDVSVPDRVEVTFPQQEMTLIKAFQHIEQQTLFRFAFTGDKLDVNARVSLPSGPCTVTEAVERLLKGTNYTYYRRQRHFIVVPREDQAPPPAAVVAPVREPIHIAQSDLKSFVPEPERGPDSVYYRSIELGPFTFGAQDNSYPTPGSPFPEGEVRGEFAGARRWQRTKLVLKTNALYGAVALAPNLHAELGLGMRTTVELGLSYNGWNLAGAEDNNRKLIHGIALGEFRYWLCERFTGHFFGLHGFGGFYNVGGRKVPMLFEKEFRYEGTTYGGGVSYGYALPLAKRWNLEFNVGVGVAVLKYDKYGCDKCSEKIGTFNKLYFGPTRAGVSIVFIIR